MNIVAVIHKESDGYHIYSESGKHLGGPYTKEKAEDRLREIEMFKHMKKKAKHSTTDEVFVESGDSRFYRVGDDFFFSDEGRVRKLTDAEADDIRGSLAEASVQGLQVSPDQQLEMVREYIHNLPAKKRRWAEGAKRKLEVGDTVRFGKGHYFEGKEGEIVDTDRKRTEWNRVETIYYVEGEDIDPEAAESWATADELEKVMAKKGGQTPENSDNNMKAEAGMATKAEIEKKHGSDTKAIAESALAVSAAVKKMYGGAHALAVRPYAAEIATKARQLYDETHEQVWQVTASVAPVTLNVTAVRKEIDNLQARIRNTDIPMGIAKIMANKLLDALRGLRQAIDNI